MEASMIIKILDEKGEVSLDTWKVVSIKENDDGTADILYKNKHVGSDGDPVFLWIYANVVEEDDDVRVLERITFKKEDILWLVRYVFPKVKVIRGLPNSPPVGGVFE
ncbi:hypothetical protein [Thermococcus peptonophilus]